MQKMKETIQIEVLVRHQLQDHQVQDHKIRHIRQVEVLGKVATVLKLKKNEDFTIMFMRKVKNTFDLELTLRPVGIFMLILNVLTSIICQIYIMVVMFY